jgi:hypothetical protein
MRCTIFCIPDNENGLNLSSSISRRIIGVRRFFRCDSTASASSFLVVLDLSKDLPICIEMDGSADLKSLYQISVAGNFPDPEVSACNIDPRSAKFVTPIVIPRNSRAGLSFALAPCYGCDHRNCPGVTPRI